MGALNELYKTINALFETKNIDSSDLDWIICEVLNIGRSEIKTHNDLTPSEIKKIYKLAKQRYKGKPLSQVLKKVNFYGFDFFVNNKVLSPRPETELLVECVLKECVKKTGLDIGAGSGAISIILNKCGDNNMTAVDISAAALKVAKKNEKTLGANVNFIKSDLFSKLKDEKFDFIVSNPPYIKTEDIKLLDGEVKNYEPIIALDGGESGFDFYEKIISVAPNYLNDGGKIYFELGIGQSEQVKKLLQKDFIEIEIIKDYNKIDRIIKATKK